MCEHVCTHTVLSPSGQIADTEKGENNVTILMTQGTQADFPVQTHCSVGDVL